MATATVEQQVDAFAVSRSLLAAQAVGAADELVSGFGDWYDTAAIRELCKAIVARVRGSQKQTAAITDAYLSRVASGMTGRRIAPVGTIDVRDLRQNVTAEGAYGRVADHYRWRVSEGDEPDVAQLAAVNRAKVVAETDTDLAFRAMANSFMEERNASGYRRIIRPERSTYGTCGLCVVAADRVYTKSELLPIHNRCKCTVLPIIGDNDPGRELNRDDLKAIYKAAGGTERKKLQATRVTINEHGELGPILTRKGDEFRDPKQVARDTRD